MLAVSRYDLAAAIWIYGANKFCWPSRRLPSRASPNERAAAPAYPTEVSKLGILIASAVLSMIVSLFSPDYAMLLYLLNLASPLAARAVYQR